MIRRGDMSAFSTELQLIRSLSREEFEFHILEWISGIQSSVITSDAALAVLDENQNEVVTGNERLVLKDLQ